MNRNYFHLHLVSDATGETLIAVSRAVAALFQSAASIEHVYPLIRSKTQLDRAIAEISTARALFSTRSLMPNCPPFFRQPARDGQSVSVSVATCHQHVSVVFGRCLTSRPGAQHMLNAEYFKRIDALNFTMMHDEGQQPENMEQADILLLGVSRTSKTPTSIYLANRGVKTANIPLVPNVPLPSSITALKKPLM